MAQLAIRGHKTRGEEIIEILEMLGGKNKYQVTAIRETYVYFVDGYTINFLKINQLLPEQFIVFTLKEFLEEFPYKIGDKVYYNNKICSIIEMLWNSNLNTISYGVYDDKIKNLAIVKELRPYEEEIMKDKAKAPKLTGQDYSEGRFGYKLPDDYEFDCIENNEIILKPIKPKYPKTYEECCGILTCCKYAKFKVSVMFPYDAETIPLLENIRKLLICRNAYWKIAGKQMGLGKSWEPDWTNNYQKKWLINFYQGEINFTTGPNVQFILAFPAEEMRDAFYDNFKELIEICKELL